MSKKNGRGVHALFQSIGDDGTTWLFSIEAHGGWVITRGDERVGAGPADRMGISAGVDQFLRLAGKEKRSTPATELLQTQRKGRKPCAS